jgi:hypothetical protein
MKNMPGFTAEASLGTKAALTRAKLRSRDEIAGRVLPAVLNPLGYPHEDCYENCFTSTLLPCLGDIQPGPPTVKGAPNPVKMCFVQYRICRSICEHLDLD